ncbi:MAG: transglutaminase domain-containing protein, partial [Candidatus Odinarchaeia archaeon]
ANSLPSSSTPSGIRTIYLQLPTSRDQYLADNPTVANVVSLFEGYAETHSVYDTALQVVGYFKSNFVYDPYTSYPGNIDRAEWLLQNGRGTCVDFATAYTVVLRCLNISARTVYGFLPGEVVGNTRVIRGWNAHLWTEVWNPTSTGEDTWIQFDATPVSDDITDIVGEDTSVGTIEYSFTVTVENNTSLVTTRGTTFELEAILSNNTGPMEGIQIEFYDEAEQYVIATGTTDSNGFVAVNFSYNNSAKIGGHVIRGQIPDMPLVQNYTAVIIDGSTDISINVTPDPPQNVTRTLTSLTVTGSFTDSLNNQPIAGQTLDVIVDGTTVGTTTTDSAGQFSFVYTPIISDENKNTSVQVSFDGSFSTVVDGTTIVFPPTSQAPSSSNVDYVDIVASTTVTTEVNVTAAVPGEWIRIYGYLYFDNGSGYSSQSVDIYWRDSTGTTLLSTETTDASGYYFYDYQIPNTVSGEIKIFTIFTSSDPYILSAFTDPTIYVGEEKITQLSINVTRTLRGNVIHISGLLTNSTNDPLPDRTVITQFYFNQTGTLIDTSSSITNQSGYFELNYLVPTTFQVGTFLINCTTTSQITVASEEVFLDVISTTSISFNIEPIFVVPGETFNITGLLVDDNSIGVTGNITLFIDGQAIGNFTAVNGALQIYNQILPFGISTSTSNITLVFNESTYYLNSSSNHNIMVFTQATVIVTVDPNIVTPGDTIHINVSAVDNYGRNIYQRKVLLFLNNTNLINTTLGEGVQVLNITLPSELPNGPISIYGVLDASIQSNYVSDTITVQEFVGMQLTADSIILITAVIVIIAAAGILYYFYKKKKRKSQVSKTDIGLSSKLSRLRSYISSKNKRDAVLLSTVLLQELIQDKYNISKKSHQTIREYTTKVIEVTDLNSKSIYELTKAYEKLKYSNRELTDSEFNQTVQHFRVLYNQLTGDDFSIG